MQYLPQRPINHGINPALQLLPPSFQVAMSTDHKSSENSVEWLTQSGFPAEEQASAHDYPIAGRVVGKQLHIPADKEDKSDKFEKEKQTAEALISVISPGIGNIQDLTIGTFSSKTIKVISKVTKRVVGSKKSSRKSYVWIESTASDEPLQITLYTEALSHCSID